MPNETNLVYQGNHSICTNKIAARKLILEAPAPQHGDPDWYDLWIASGFLATLVVKIAVANFGLALMALADPFVVCAGEYLGLPGTSMDSGIMSAILKSKRRSLLVVALSKSVFWGFVMHFCLFNMFTAAYVGVGEETAIEEALNDRDKRVLLGCLYFAMSVAGVGIYVIGKIRESMAKQRSQDAESTDEEGEWSDSNDEASINEQRESLSTMIEIDNEIQN